MSHHDDESEEREGKIVGKSIRNTKNEKNEKNEILPLQPWLLLAFHLVIWVIFVMWLTYCITLGSFVFLMHL